MSNRCQFCHVYLPCTCLFKGLVQRKECIIFLHVKLTLDIVGEFGMHASDHYTSDPKSSFAAAVAEGKEEDDPPEVFLYKERATDHGELPELSVSGCSDARLGIRETSELEPSTASVGSASTSAARSFSSNCTSCCLRIYRLQDS